MVNCKTDAGRLVFISSIDAYVAEPHCPAYNASKAAIHGLMRSMARDYARHHITSNAVAPGWIATPMLGEALPPEVLSGEAPFALTPVGRIGVPRDIGEAAAWLADPGSSFVNGTVVLVDGGQLAKAATPASWTRVPGGAE
jgi:NAD(P)-dependent dehydrogenase (short-subunit alcohol dehydrogenase family)